MRINMKYIFVLNPVAGIKNYKDTLENELKKIDGLDYQIVCTEYPGHAKKIVQEYLEKYSGQDIAFYACGGDGTLNEVASMVAGTEAKLGVIPCGSGNDFVKFFGGAEKFFDIKKNINGKIKPIDILKIGDNYSINVCNFGFDAVVAKTANETKTVGGKKSYTKGIIKGLFCGMSHKIKVEVDGKLINNKAMLLCTLANGSYVGGKYCCAPKSVIDDGLVEVCLVDKVSIFTFISILGKYTKGEHLGLNKKFIHYTRGKVVKMYSDKDFDICLDGEIVTGNNFTLEVIKNNVNFIVPED